MIHKYSTNFLSTLIFLILISANSFSNSNNYSSKILENPSKNSIKPYYPLFVNGEADVQIIHNSPDPSLIEVDIYVNDELLQANFSFRTATSFLALPAGEDLDIAIAVAGSTSSASAFFNTTLNLVENEKYVVVANGVQNPSLFNATINNPIDFSLDIFTGARETAIAIAGNTDILVHHGVTDYPNLDIGEITIPIPSFVSSLSYTNFNDYVQIATNNYTIQPEFSDGSNSQDNYDLPLDDLNLQNKAITLLTSGFLNPQANEDGPDFGLWIALPEGGQLIELPFEGNCVSLSTPYTEDFSSSDWVVGTGFSNVNNEIDDCWTANPEGGNIGVYSWGTGNSDSTFFSSGPSGPFAGSNYAYANFVGATGDEAFLTTPIINTANLETPAVSFYYYMFGVSVGSLEMQVKEFGFENWFTLTTINGQQQTSNNQDWLQQEIDLSGFENTNIQIRFKAVRGGGFSSAIAIDLVQIQEVTTCLTPTNINVSQISDTSVQLNWGTQSNPINWFVYNEGDNPNSSTPVVEGSASASDISTLISNLSPNTEYQVYLESDCGEGDISNLSFAVDFTTAVCPIEDQCSFTFNLLDDFGDGWNGNIVELRQEGTVIAQLGASFTSGSSFTETINLCTDSSIELIWLNQGNFVNEVGLNVVDSFGDEIFDLPFESGNQQGSTIFSFTANCVPPTCPKVQNVFISNVSDTSADISWDFVSNANQGYTWFVFNEGANPNTATAVVTGSVGASENTDTITGLESTQNYDVYVQANCATNDISDLSNVVSFSTACTLITAPYLEDFSSNQWVSGTGFFNTGDAISQCWTRNEINYRWGTRSGSTSLTNSGPSGAIVGTKYIYASGATGNNGQSATITSPQIDLTNLTNPGITFFYHMFGSGIASLDLQVKTVQSSNWATLIEIDGEQQTSSDDDWSESVVSLSAFQGETIEYRFIATRGNSFNADIAVDAIEVNNVNPCLRPTDLEVSNIELDQVELSWQAADNSSVAFNWEIYLQGEDPDFATPVASGTTGANATTAIVTGLEANTQYVAYVISECSGNTFSNLSLPLNFATQACSENETCDYTFTLVDTFGDGWNGNTMSVFQNGQLVQVLGENFTNGSEDVETVALCSDASIELFWNANGGFASEVGVIISNPFDEEIYEKDPGEGTQNTSLFTFTSDCDAPEGCFPPIGFDVLETTTDSVELTWENIGSAISGYNWFIFNAADNPQSTTPVANGSTGFEINTVIVSGLDENTAYKAYIRSDCGFTGVSPISEPLFFNTPCSAFDAPFLENFEGSQWNPQPTGNESIDSCWERNPEFDISTYSWLTFSSTAFNNPVGENFLLVTDQLGTAGDVAIIELPAINLSDLEDPSLNYFYSITGNNVDSYSVEIKVDGTDSWTNLITYTDAVQNNTNEEFVREIFDLQAYADQTVNIRFVGNNAGSSSSVFALDDLRVDELPICNAPLNLSITDIETDSATLSFDTDESAINGYVWFVYPTGADPETASAIISGNSSNGLNVALSNLDPATTYDVYVQSSCLNNEVSELSIPVTFSTKVCEEVDQCAYNFTLLSDAGNGWNGATMEVFQDGILVATLGENFSNGAELDEVINLCDDVTTELIWNVAGSASSEVNISVTNPYNEEIYNSTGQTINVGQTLFSFTSSCTPPVCPLPLNLEVSEVTQTTALISWEEADATQLSYNWFVYLDGDNPNIDTPVEQGSTSAGVTSTTVSNLTLDTAYQVYVQAECEFTDSELSSPEDFTTFGTCEIPENVFITAITLDTATINWDLTLNASNGYNWFVFLAGDNPETATPVISGAVAEGENSVDVSGLQEETNYDVYVQADCDVLLSELSQVTSFATFGQCDAPQNVNLVELTNTSAEFSWDNVSNANLGYNWYVFNAGDDPETNTAIDTGILLQGENTVTVDGLQESTTYDFYVEADCELLISDFSTAFQFTTLDSACDAPQNLLITSIEADQITLTWSEVEQAANGYFWYIFDEFDIPEQGTALDFGNVDFGQTSVVIDGLNENTTYQVVLESDCSGTFSDFSEPIVFTTENLTCETPDNFEVSLVTDTSATLSWEAITDDTENLTFGGYTWFIYNAGDIPGVDTPAFTSNTVETSVDLNNLNPETAYEAYVQANCDTGDSNLTSAVAFTTTSTEDACQPVENIVVSNIGQTSILLSWNPPADAPVVSYEWVIQENVTGFPVFSSGSVDSSITEVSIDGLNPNTSYLANIVTDCGTVSTFPGDSVQFTTLDTTDFPPNDDVCNVTSIPEFSTVIGDNTNATVQTNEPTPSCFTSNVESTVWFSYVAPSANDTDIIVQTLNNQGIARVAIFEAPTDCNDLNTLVEVACQLGDDQSTIVSPSGLTPGETYYVQVDFEGAGNEGTFEIFLNSNFSNQDFNKLQISLYPNPASNLLNLEAPESIEDIIIYNMLGQQVYKQKHNQNSVAIPVSNLESGQYFVKVFIDGKTYVEAFIKK